MRNYTAPTDYDRMVCGFFVDNGGRRCSPQEARAFRFTTQDRLYDAYLANVQKEGGRDYLDSVLSIVLRGGSVPAEWVEFYSDLLGAPAEGIDSSARGLPVHPTPLEDYARMVREIG